MGLDVHPWVVDAVVDGTTVILGPDMQFVRLDAVGTAIWELIGQGHDIDGVAGGLTERYDVSMETAREDVEEFVEHLHTVGLLTLSE